MSTIAAVRYKTGLSQASFAKQFGISLRTLQQWEQGRSNPPAYVESMINTILSLKEKQETAESEHKAHPAKVHRIAPRTTWKVCIERPFDNCEHIYPIQQRKIRAILDRVEGIAAVKKVFVFGSSVTPTCHIGSDVDIYFELDGESAISLSDFDFEVDYWNNYTVDERLKKEIYKKGLVVYEQ